MLGRAADSVSCPVVTCPEVFVVTVYKKGWRCPDIKKKAPKARIASLLDGETVCYERRLRLAEGIASA